MLQIASSNIPREIKIKAPLKNTLFANKKCTCTVGNPQEMEDKGFIQSSHFLQFEVLIQGDVASQVHRKDQEFTDLHKYLTIKYPNALVPHVDKNMAAKKFTEEYMTSRGIALTRFVNYCLMSDTIKQDEFFEKFFDTSNPKEF